MAERRSDHQTRSAIGPAVAGSGGTLQKLLSLIWCEWLVRKWWLLLASLIGLVTLFSPPQTLAPGIPAHFVLFFPIFTLAAGLSMNLREIREQRRGFYLAKPVSGTLHWSGKFLAGLSLVVMLMVALALPSIALGLWGEYLSRTFLVSLAAFPIFAVALWAGIAIGTRTSWLGLDLLILPASGFLAWWAFDRMHSSGLAAGARTGAGLAAVVALVAFIVAPAVSSSRGGIDKGRSHRLLSVALWSLLGLGLLSQGIYYYWYQRPSIGNLKSLRVVDAPPSGPWILLSGPAWGRHGTKAQFLFNTESGRSLLLDRKSDNLFFSWSPYPQKYRYLSYSSNGALAAWATGWEWQGSEIPLLHVARLEPPDPQITSMRLPDYGWGAEVSPDGSRCALVLQDGVVVIKTRDLVVEDQIDFADLPARCGSIHFLGEKRLRCKILYQYPRVKIFDIELREEGWTASEQPPVIRDAGELVSPLGGTVVRRVEGSEGDDPGIAFIDGLTGEIRQRLAGERYHRYWTLSDFMSGDRLALFNSKSLQLEIFDSAGNVIQRFEIAQRPQSNFVLVDPKTILFTVISSRSRNSIELRAIDLESGHIRKVASGLRPVAGHGTELLIAPEPGSPISKLFYDRNGSLVFFDPLTGERETLLELGHRSEKEQDRG